MSTRAELNTQITTLITSGTHATSAAGIRSVMASIVDSSRNDSDDGDPASQSALNDHTGNVSNPHEVTKAQVGLTSVDDTSDTDKPVSTAQRTYIDEQDAGIQDFCMSALVGHTGNKSNPHEVTAAQVGLSNVDDTSDANKPISSAVQDALDAIVSGTQAELDLKATNDALTAHTSATNNPHAVTKAQVGLGSVENTADAAKPVSTATQTALDLKATVSALSSHTGNSSNPHAVTKAQVGLGNAENTSDANKPISTAVQAALDLKQDAGGGSGGDFLSVLTSNEVALTAATTLTGTAFGKMHLVTLTSAAATIDLPAVSGNAKKFIGFRMANTATKWCTLDGATTETIDGSLTRKMQNGETAILMCTGTEWIKVFGKSRPVTGIYERPSAQTITANTYNTLIFDTPLYESVTGMLNTSTGVFTIPRPGKYMITGQVTMEKNSDVGANQCFAILFENGARATAPAAFNGERISNGVSSDVQSSFNATRDMNAAETIEVAIYHTASASMTTRTTDIIRPAFTVIEVTDW